VQKLGAFVRQRLRKSEEEDDDNVKFHVPVDESSGFKASKPVTFNVLQIFEASNFVLFWT
jgi:hypothetical protein